MAAKRREAYQKEARVADGGGGGGRGKRSKRARKSSALELFYSEVLSWSPETIGNDPPLLPLPLQLLLVLLLLRARVEPRHRPLVRPASHARLLLSAAQQGSL